MSETQLDCPCVFKFTTVCRFCKRLHADVCWDQHTKYLEPCESVHPETGEECTFGDISMCGECFETFELNPMLLEPTDDRFFHSDFCNDFDPQLKKKESPPPPADSDDEGEEPPLKKARYCGRFDEPNGENTWLEHQFITAKDWSFIEPGCVEFKDCTFVADLGDYKEGDKADYILSNREKSWISVKRNGDEMKADVFGLQLMAVPRPPGWTG